ncbi:SMI1/KNR4 family protein, partial [Streptomyces sp. Act-28]
MNEHAELLSRVAIAAADDVRPRTGRPRRPPAPVTTAGVEAAETALGFPLPGLLAALHTTVADGGFGPDHGLFPLRQAVSRYLALRRPGAGDDADRPWPEGVLPTADLGCAMLACVDCRTPEGTVLLFEPDPGDVDRAWYVLAPDLATWFTAWLEGTSWFAEDQEFDGDLPPGRTTGRGRPRAHDRHSARPPARPLASARLLAPVRPPRPRAPGVQGRARRPPAPAGQARRHGQREGPCP